MTFVLGLAGVKHSPGVTTLALAAASAHPGPALVIEADPAGGDIAPRAGLGVDPGLVSLAATARNGMSSELVAASIQRLRFEVDLLAAPVSPRHAATVLQTMSQPLADLCPSLGYDLVAIDLGRIDDPSRVLPFLGVADRVVLVLRATAEDVAAARSRLEELQRHARSAAIAVVESGPFRADEITAALGTREAVSIPWDPRAARELATGRGPDRWLRRSPLLRSAPEVVAGFDHRREAAS
jgi:hypothetical protein